MELHNDGALLLVEDVLGVAVSDIGGNEADAPNSILVCITSGRT